MKSRLLGIGTAVPAGSVTRSESVEIALRLALPGCDRAAVERLATRAGVDSRASVLVGEHGDYSYYPPPRDADSRGPTTSARLESGRIHAIELGSVAAARALEHAGVARSSITHIVSASCTVAEAPGFDQGIIERLGLSRDVRRTHIGFMGCHAAINALATASAIAASAPDAVVLVCCVELSTLHMHYTDRADQLIANALFADGAAAAIVAADHPGRGESPALAAFASRIFVDAAGASTAPAMGWRIGDHGFEMTLGREVPEHLRAGVPGWIDGMLARESLSRDKIGSWAIHPGGPRIVRTIVDALELQPEAREQGEGDAMGILHAHGNMSSATVLFILERLMLRSAPRPWVAMAFGPGLAGEGMLIR